LSIANTLNDQLYRTERWVTGNGGDGLVFNVAVPVTGLYHVRLHWSENYPPNEGVGLRVMDVSLEGLSAVSGYDMYAEAGNQLYSALRRSFSITVVDGVLSLEITASADNPTLLGLEVYADVSLGDLESTPTPSTTTTAVVEDDDDDESALPTAYRINCGGPTITDSDGLVWQADVGFDNGATFTTATAIVNSNNPIYQSERFGVVAEGNLKYNLPMANGQYTVVLHLAEIAFGTTNARKFDITVQGATLVTDLDLVAEVGTLTATTFALNNVVVDEGVLRLRFKFGSANNPKINGIVVLAK
jgi:hypothetical protein